MHEGLFFIQKTVTTQQELSKNGIIFLAEFSVKFIHSGTRYLHSVYHGLEMNRLLLAATFENT